MKKQTGKYYGLLLGMTMALATGCSGGETAYTSAAKENQPATEASVSETKQIIIETEAAAETNAAETTASTQESDAAGTEGTVTVDTTAIPDQLHIDVQYLYETKWEDSQQIFNGKVSQIYVLGDEYPALQNTLLRLNQTNQEDLETLYHEQVEYAKEMVQTYPDYPGFEFERSMAISRADQQILSIELEEYSWLGGAHPNTYIIGYNYAPATGERLKLQDVAAEYDTIYEHVLSELESRTVDIAYFEDYKDTVKTLFYDTSGQYGEVQWSMDLTGVTIYFNTYDIAPYAAGRVVIELPFSEYGEWFKPEYVYTGTKYAKAVKTNENYAVDLNGDGTMERLMLMDNVSEESYGSRLLIDVGEMSAEVPLMGYYVQSYLLHTEDGRSYLYVESTGDSDYSFLEIFELQPKMIGPKGLYQDGSLYSHGIQNPDDFVLYTRLDALGTYIGYRSYQLGEDGLPVTDETVYELLNYQTGNDYVITSVVKLPVELHQKDAGGTTMVSEKLPAGTRFHLRRTDGKSFVEAQLDDGRTCTIRYEMDGYRKQINGMDEFDCFETLFYAG